ncbi:Kynurenine--oxoglutarate transaminase 1, mitochondrial [Microtus ochrogaster]|uniref:28S rRNA (uridine-N(3))-methyltransferase n=1 Tax=Microtus ochrogaster TaxID=79684 RepID=A0A8J6G6H9_MICOH|nr:Kynurenine--oxoglutarate transaminase 1, mitochondrial [Microtus ochrogaster]
MLRSAAAISAPLVWPLWERKAGASLTLARCLHQTLIMAKQLQARRLNGIDHNPWVEFIRLAKEYDVVNLGQGFPDFSPPDFAVQAFQQATSGDFMLNQYTMAFGYPPLTKILASFFGKLLGQELDPLKNVLVTVGAYGALFTAFQALVDEGDEVIIIEPAFDCYEPMTLMAGGRPVFVSLKPSPAAKGQLESSNDWQLEPTELASKFTPRTKALVLNTPNNPLGKVFSKKELELVADLCQQHDVLCISDEVYQWLVYDGHQHVSIASLPGMWERTLTIGSAGKSFSATGWKVGWVMGPDRILKHLRTVHQNSIFHCPTQAQAAVAQCFEREQQHLGQPSSYFLQLPQTMKPNRDHMIRSLQSVGLKPLIPQGSYFLIADISDFKSKMPDLPGAEDEPYDRRFANQPHQKDFDHYIRFCFVKGEHGQRVEWRKWKQQKKEEKKKWKDLKMMKKLERQRAQEEQAKRQEEEEAAAQSSDQGRPYTLSVALPGSILDNAQSPELRTYLAGQIARACTIFCVDEIVVFDEEGQDTKTVEGEFRGVGKKGQACVQLARILQYLECPQYLRKAFFPKHQDLQFAGILNPLDSPHHMRQDEESEFREGVVVDRPTKAGHGSLVNCGMKKEVKIDKKLEPGLRVTVRLNQKQLPECKTYKGTVVSSQDPRTKAGLYWGYTVRLASCLSKDRSSFPECPSVLGGAVFAEAPFQDGYDLTIGTSERGSNVASAQLPSFRHALVVFGGLQGLEAGVDADPNLEVSEPSVLFDFYVNTCPSQGSRTIRTEVDNPSACSRGPAHPLILPGSWAAGCEDKEELDSQLFSFQEAILISLAALQPGLTQAGSQTT